MSLRGIIPSLYIRLGQDQSAYDFMKWYATTGQGPDYDWDDVYLPFLHLHGEDALEPLKDTDGPSRAAFPLSIVSPRALDLDQICSYEEDLKVCTNCDTIYYCSSACRLYHKSSHSKGCAQVRKLLNLGHKIRTPLYKFLGDATQRGDERRKQYAIQHELLIQQRLSLLKEPHTPLYIVAQCVDSSEWMMKQGLWAAPELQMRLPALYIALNADVLAFMYMMRANCKNHKVNAPLTREQLAVGLEQKYQTFFQFPMDRSVLFYTSQSYYWIPTTLIKVRLIMDLKIVQHYLEHLQDKSVDEKLELLRPKMIGSGLLSWPRLLQPERQWLAMQIGQVREQIHVCSQYAGMAAPELGAAHNFWKLMLQNEKSPIDRRDIIIYGDDLTAKYETLVLINMNRDVWRATNDVIKVFTLLGHVK
ncbi:Zinc finger, MYND-type [Metarhizium rileyi]|uniref:Zinc finger, MYND-type n=1 Tax=Metarhizium rileyi (strain RCEF 4871) TaxID=1649241 RepID=A0A166VSG5_METRR|nr:Zinc finger, MYND-type [Metarhizium rileyi RCEF 4871]